MSDERPHAAGTVDAGDTSERVGMAVLRERGLEPEELREKLLDAIGVEFTTYYYYTNLRMHLAGHEDYKEITEDARLEDRAHFELLSMESDGETNPAGHFVRGEPGDAPLSTNRRFNDSA